MATVTRENIAPLNDKLTVTVAKNDYLTAFEQSLKKYAKTATIPGFRKGLVPTGLIKKLHGKAVLTEEVLRMVDKELQNYLEQEKLDIFAQPLQFDNTVPDFDANNPGDYAFSFEIGLRPDVDIDVDHIHVTRYKIEVTEQMINDEVNRLQVRHGKMTDPETVTVEDNVLNVQLTETDAEGNEVEGGVSKANSLLLKYFAEPVRSELMGKQKDDTIIIQLNKAFEEKERGWVMGDLGLDKDNAADTEKFFKLTITKVGLIERPEMNVEFFEAAYPGKGIETEEAFRAAVVEEIESHFKAQSSNQVHDQIYHHLIDHTNLEFPESFLKRWLQTGGEKPKTEEEAAEELPHFLGQLKWSLISTKLIQDNQIKVEQEEILDQARQQMISYMGGQALGDLSWLDDYAKRMLNDKKFVDQAYAQIQTTKLFNALEAKVHATEESISAEEFAHKQHHHHY
jgi:trigger factor